MRWHKRAQEARSFEGRYRSPQRNHHEPVSPFRPVSERVDLADAEAIESAVCLIDSRYHALLRARYVYRAHQRVLARLVAQVGFRRPRPGDVEAGLAMAKALLARALEVPPAERRGQARAWVVCVLGELPMRLVVV